MSWDQEVRGSYWFGWGAGLAGGGLCLLLGVPPGPLIGIGMIVVALSIAHLRGTR